MVETLIFGTIGSIVAGLIIKHWNKIVYIVSDRKVIDKIFIEVNKCIENNTDINSALHEKLFLKLFKKKPINKELIQNFNKEESSIFLLGLQFYYRKLKISNELMIDSLTLLADKASDCIRYKKILLKMSLSSFLIDDIDNLHNEILENSKIIQVGFKFNDADSRLIEVINHIENDSLYIFSTTSQISNFQLDIFNSSKNNINELNLFMVSPLIESHNALLNLKKEYDVPDFAIPRLQFVTKNLEFDLLRRVIKILQAIEKLFQLQNKSQITCNLYLFKEKYPDIKIVLFEKGKYLQLFPNPLKFVNNIYRFGLEITNNSTVSKISKHISNNVVNSSIVEKVELNNYSLEKLKRNAIKEIYWYLIKANQDIELINQYRTDFNLILKDPQVDMVLNKILLFDKKTKEFSKNYSFKKSIASIDVNKSIQWDKIDNKNIVVKNVDNTDAHISVGVLFFNESKKKILLITKNQNPYKGKRSIIAGHLEKGESPLEAIKREVKEEIGIEVVDFNLLKHYELIKGDICRYNKHNHIWYLFLSSTLVDINTLKVSNSEISSIEWYLVDKLKEINQFTYATKYMFSDLSLI